MKDTLRTIVDTPVIGMGTAFTGSLIHYLEAFNPILSFASLAIGISVGTVTLWRMIK